MKLKIPSYERTIETIAVDPLSAAAAGARTGSASDARTIAAWLNNEYTGVIRSRGTF